MVSSARVPVGRASVEMADALYLAGTNIGAVEADLINIAGPELHTDQEPPVVSTAVTRRCINGQSGACGVPRGGPILVVSEISQVAHKKQV